MSIEDNHDQHDDAVDKVLTAMRGAPPPEGMEARIVQRLQQRAVAPSGIAPRWRNAFAISARDGAYHAKVTIVTQYSSQSHRLFSISDVLR